MLIGIAFAISIPLAWIASARWLNDFSYRITVPWWVFPLAGAAVLLVAFVTISFHPYGISPLPHLRKKTRYMLRTYLLPTWRNLRRNKAYALINISGLAIGICACIIIYIVAGYEFSFDDFHPACTHEIPGIEAISGFYPYAVDVTVPGFTAPRHFPFRQNNTQPNIIIADTAYFSIFPYKWLAGNPSIALTHIA